MLVFISLQQVRLVAQKFQMLSASPSIVSIVLLFCTIFVLLIIIVDKNNNGVEGKPVLNYDNHLHTKFNEIYREGFEKNSTTNRSRNFKKYVKYSYGISNGGQQIGGRVKRQFDFNIDADYEAGVGTDVVASASANLYKSYSGEIRVDGTARYSQHFRDYAGHGKAKIGGSLHFSHQ